jgi:hypothetical protein
MSKHRSSKKKQEKQLLALRKRIIDKYYATPTKSTNWKEVWFFPSHKGIQGFLGTQKIIFLGLNPSSGLFPTKRDEFFYGQLKANGFQDAHITDLIKLKSTNKKITELEKSPDFEDQCCFLHEEMKIIDPKLIVFLGKKVQDLYNQYLKERYTDIKGITTKRIPHYSYRWGNDKRIKEKFSEKMKDIKKQYKNALGKA